MDKYSEVQTAVRDLTSMVQTPQETVRNHSSGYTTDTIMYKKESLGLPKELEEIVQDGGSIGLIDGVSSAWGSVRGKLVIWNYSTQMISEIEMKSQEVRAIFAIKRAKGVFTSNVQYCILIFSEQSISMMCLCKNPVTYISMDISVDLPVGMTCVCENDNGRIFMGGKDGNIYEFIYNERSWLKGYTAKIVSHTHGIMAHVLPFLYAMGRRAAIQQIVPTYRGLLVLYKDNTLEAYTLEKHLKKIRTADLAELNTTDTIQLVRMDDAKCQAYLILPDATRLFLDCSGYLLGKRPMTRARIRSRLVAPSSIKNESFYQIGKSLVSFGKNNSEVFITAITRNKTDVSSPENCCTIMGGAEYAHAALSGGSQWKNLAECCISGEEVAFLAHNRLDIYHIMNGVELMERASTNPEGMFAFMQRNGPELSMLSALYAVAGGASSPAIDSFFKKSESLQKNAIAMCAGIIVYKVWSIDIYAMLKEDMGLEAGEYIDEIEAAISKARRLKNFIIRECVNINNIRIAEGTVVDMLDNIEETLHYISILMESDALYIFDEAKKKSGGALEFTYSNFLKPVTDLRKATLNALVDLNLSQKATVDSITMELNEKCSTLFALTDTLLLKGKEAIEKASRAATSEDRKWYLIKSMEFFTKTAAKKYLPEIVEMYSNVRFSKGILYAIRAGFSSITEEEATAYFKKIECTEEILQEGLKDERPAMCNALLNAAIAKIVDKSLSVDVLLKIKSPYLEDYLDRLDRTSESLELCDLIWKYHLKNQNYSTAARYLLRSSERTKPAITLEKRIEYISIACTMQSASKGCDDSALVGHIRNYMPRLGICAKERLCMVQRQADVLSALSCAYNIGGAGIAAPQAIVEETFVRLDTGLLSFEELFEICVMFGFSVLALKISTKGEIDDPVLMKTLWEDALSGPYGQCVEVLKENPDIMAGAPLDMVFDILARKKVEEPQSEENLGSVLVSLGSSTMKAASMLEQKGMSSEYASPRSKKIIFNEAIAFCEMHNLTEIRHRISSFKASLGI
ncbi:hypothetical protein NEAUS04_0491 [Nematocida ausubeli]|uniref:Nucleoporin Nup133/Nup155-like N-terminal domain-containing protein n=2 Tax=Nematocida ausubeli (strain ATCC PRA-371 / ERTm2) TaxID=1913371 RepID=A0A086J4M1_NEMA1|nr:uncharacterized protein NESG_00164 [Nematocida ausubeli]KAI5135119.1 hypothetical protein NEAUS07_1002 [Nematocida ausubeli]KAI5137231.1 hypothetical protein NEAUS06_2156 [Nematocida ausubeli]KAI5147389.1 hypothetical protein NEAUS05_0698 [Nematocida ausubeli]KAI5161391.1 hypothetical protein NEAUS04_0491 [Nematocida ausubeli]KFG27089.1 hypothetical protein NESG_00164 [Nematocida ausubeli]